MYSMIYLASNWILKQSKGCKIVPGGHRVKLPKFEMMEQR